MTAPTTDAPARQMPVTARRTLAAIGLIVLAVTLFTALDTVAKLLSTRFGIPVAQIVWLRFVGQTIYIPVLFALVYGAMRLPELVATRRLGLQVVRSILMVATTACNFYAIQTLRLDQTVTIVFMAPLVVAALAGPLLGEWVGWRRGLAIVIGFAGVLIAMHPTSEGLSPAVWVSFAGMLAYAFFMLLTRHLAPIDPPLVTLLYSMLAGTVLGGPIAAAQWVPPADALTWAMLASLGMLGGLGHLLFIFAYKMAPASTVSPFIYAQLLTMVSAGWLVFGDVPDAWTLSGATIVIASGIYLVHREHVRSREPHRNNT
jgi:drug/metabolite transporter (DMT)-like permease